MSYWCYTVTTVWCNRVLNLKQLCYFCQNMMPLHNVFHNKCKISARNRPYTMNIYSALWVRMSLCFTLPAVYGLGDLTFLSQAGAGLNDSWPNVIHTYTTTKKSFATLQPVEQRGTSIFWNGHNIANTACIHFKFGTMNNRYMPNSKPMKLGKT